MLSPLNCVNKIHEDCKCNWQHQADSHWERINCSVELSMSNWLAAVLVETVAYFAVFGCCVVRLYHAEWGHLTVYTVKSVSVSLSHHWSAVSQCLCVYSLLARFKRNYTLITFCLKSPAHTLVDTACRQWLSVCHFFKVVRPTSHSCVTDSSSFLRTFMFFLPLEATSLLSSSSEFEASLVGKFVAFSSSLNCCLLWYYHFVFICVSRDDAVLLYANSVC